jgi:Na+-transporting NADH:ubiquinone oxidoreductase subunit NqrD
VLGTILKHVFLVRLRIISLILLVDELIITVTTQIFKTTPIWVGIVVEMMVVMG